MNVAVIGASDKPDRYSYQALKLLQEKGHKVYLVHQRIKTIDGLSVYASIKEIEEPIDTVSMYVASNISNLLAQDILAKNPKRIIFNPGSQNPQLVQKAQAVGIKTLEACTLVMLRTGQF
ncbi:MAG: CoA-binding protein [Candidatus Omnitrophota bacterium]